MTTPAALVLGDPHAGHELDLDVVTGKPVATLRTFVGLSNAVGTIDLTRDDLRALVRWACDALGESPALAAQPYAFRGQTEDGEPWTIASRDLGPCPVCGHGVHAGAFIAKTADGRWKHDGCTTLDRVADDPEALVTVVEGTRQ